MSFQDVQTEPRPDTAAERVVDELDRYAVVEKRGEAGDLAEALDARAPEGR